LALSAPPGERWFQVAPNEATSVLKLPTQGSQLPGPSGLSREFESRVVEQHATAAGYKVIVRFGVRYWFETFDTDTAIQLFSKTQVATFNQPSGKPGFELVSSESDLDNRQIEHVYNIDSLSAEDFLRYNLEELSMIARQGTGRQKSWLREFLLKVRDVPERSILSRLLDRQ